MNDPSVSEEAVQETEQEPPKNKQETRKKAAFDLFVGALESTEELKVMENPMRDRMAEQAVAGRQDAGIHSLEQHTWEGLPYKGPAYPFKDKDPEHLQPQPAQTCHIKVFRTWEKDEMEEWEKVLQKVAEGTSVVSFEEKQFDPAKGGWHILLRWLDLFYEAPKAVQRSSTHGR